MFQSMAAGSCSAQKRTEEMSAVQRKKSLRFRQILNDLVKMIHMYILQNVHMLAQQIHI